MRRVKLTDAASATDVTRISKVTLVVSALLNVLVAEYLVSDAAGVMTIEPWSVGEGAVLSLLRPRTMKSNDDPEGMLPERSAA